MNIGHRLFVANNTDSRTGPFCVLTKEVEEFASRTMRPSADIIGYDDYF